MADVKTGATGGKQSEQRKRIQEGERNKKTQRIPSHALQRAPQPAIFISKDLAVQIQVEGPVGGRDRGLNPQPLTPGLSLLPRARQQKPGQVHCCSYALNYPPHST